MGIRGLLAEDGFSQEWCISQKQTITIATDERIVDTCLIPFPWVLKLLFGKCGNTQLNPTPF
jgi:hypothetical protein